VCLGDGCHPESANKVGVARNDGAIERRRYTFERFHITQAFDICRCRSDGSFFLQRRACVQAMEASIDSGIEIVMINVLRQLPRNSRIISPVSAAAIIASRITPEMAARTKIDWSPSVYTLSAGGKVA